MKRIITAAFGVLLLVAALLLAVACQTVDADGLWETAEHRRDKTFGSGGTTVSVTVEVGESSVVFTVKTDKTTLADALLEHNLIGGEESVYGFTIYTVNGIEADFTRDNAYWAVYIGDSYAPTGVSLIEIEDGAEYKFVYEVYGAV